MSKNPLRLSASSSKQWMTCAGSVQAQVGIPRETSIYAEEGILAHTIAAKYLDNKIFHIENNEPLLGAEKLLPLESYAMKKHLNTYLNYIKRIIDDGETKVFYIEQKVDYSNIIPSNPGIADCVIFKNNHLHVVDLKYGMGVIEHAKDNTQLLLYGIGAINTFKSVIESIGVPEHITLHIVQPRIGNIDHWTLDINTLKDWARKINEAGAKTQLPGAVRIPSQDACKFCLAKPTCYAIHDHLQKTIFSKTDKLEDLTNDELKVVLDNMDLVTDFLASVKKKVRDELTQGKTFPGYKLVEGKGRRVIDKNKESELYDEFGEVIYQKNLIGVTELESLIGRTEIRRFVTMTNPQPSLVPENDTREALNFNYNNKFENLN
jgi:hypothetical protein